MKSYKNCFFKLNKLLVEYFISEENVSQLYCSDIILTFLINRDRNARESKCLLLPAEAVFIVYLGDSKFISKYGA